MAIANGTNFATSAGQETYATTKEWTLPSGDGLKTVCIKFYNTAGYLFRRSTCWNSNYWNWSNNRKQSS
jgi:hypothetical protein